MDAKRVARELVAVAKELTAYSKKMKFDKVQPGQAFMYKGKTYWKASRTRAVLQKYMTRIRPDEEVEVITSASMTAAKRPSSRIRRRLEQLRKEIENETISYGEIAELESLADYIDDDDVLLLEWAGVPEGSRR